MGVADGGARVIAVTAVMMIGAEADLGTVEDGEDVRAFYEGYLIRMGVIII